MRLWKTILLVKSFKERCEKVKVELDPNSFTICISDYDAFDEDKFMENCISPTLTQLYDKCFSFKPRTRNKKTR